MKYTQQEKVVAIIEHTTIADSLEEAEENIQTGNVESSVIIDIESTIEEYDIEQGGTE